MNGITNFMVFLKFLRHKYSICVILVWIRKAETLLNGKNLVFLATSMADGSPQVTPVWGDFEGSYIRINTARRQVKAQKHTS